MKNLNSQFIIAGIKPDTGVPLKRLVSWRILKHYREANFRNGRAATLRKTIYGWTVCVGTKAEPYQKCLGIYSSLRKARVVALESANKEPSGRPETEGGAK